jgi:hypothetical protein
VTCAGSLRRDRHHGARLRHVGGSGEHGGTTQAVADQDRGRPPDFAQGARRRQQVGDIGGERRVGELAFARAKPGEIEAQHADAERGQRLRNAARRRHVLAAGEAMREQRIGLRLPGRHVEECREPLALGVDEVEPFGGHRILLHLEASTQARIGFQPRPKILSGPVSERDGP